MQLPHMHPSQLPSAYSQQPAMAWRLAGHAAGMASPHAAARSSCAIPRPQGVQVALLCCSSAEPASWAVTPHRAARVRIPLRSLKCAAAQEAVQHAEEDEDEDAGIVCVHPVLCSLWLACMPDSTDHFATNPSHHCFLLCHSGQRR